MELEKAIKTRRSIRLFSDQPLEKGILEKIIEAGSYAPSHCNTQGWKFIFVDEAALKEKIFSAGGSHVVKKAPFGILVLYNTALSDNEEYQDWRQSGSAAIENMLLTIHDLGLGGCWVCHLPSQNKMRRIFNIPTAYSLVAYMAFGYPKAEPEPVARRSRLDEILARNIFTWPVEKTSPKIYFRRILKKIYLILPDFIKKALLPITDKWVKKFNN